MVQQPTTKPHPLDTLRGIGQAGAALTDTFQVDIDGAPWSVASDGFRFLLVKGLHTGPDQPPAPEALESTVRATLAAPLEYPCFATLPQLLTFGGVVPGCPQCGDACKNCGPQTDNRVQYQGQSYNWDWVRSILAGLKAAQVRISRCGQVLRIDTREWVYVQMCMFIDAETRAQYPDLAAYLAG